MEIKKNIDGSLIVPKSIETEDFIIDTFLMILVDNPEYSEYLKIYEIQKII